MIAVNFRDFLGDPLWIHANDVRVVTSISFNPSNRILFDHERGNLDPGFPRRLPTRGAHVPRASPPRPRPTRVPNSERDARSGPNAPAHDPPRPESTRTKRQARGQLATPAREVSVLGRTAK